MDMPPFIQDEYNATPACSEFEQERVCDHKTAALTRRAAPAHLALEVCDDVGLEGWDRDLLQERVSQDYAR